MYNDATMQWPNHDIQPPRKPHGSRIDRRIQRYPPPVSGNAEPSSMYAIAVNMVTTKFRPNARTSEGPGIAKPGPTGREVGVPIGGTGPGRRRRSDVLMHNRAQLDSRLEGGSVAVCSGEVLARRVGGHRGPRARQRRHRHKGRRPTSVRSDFASK